MAKKKQGGRKITNKERQELLDYAEEVVKSGGFEEDEETMRKRLAKFREFLNRK